MPEYKLIIDVDHDTDLWYFFVQEGQETIHFRPGFRTKEEAQSVGDSWIRENLKAAPPEGN
jgi:hypothetical protein